MLFSSTNHPPGFYVYLYLREDETPYYVGKGKKGRAWNKGHNVILPKDKSKIVITHWNLTELWALAMERWLIRWYGRKDIGTGILRNITCGGDGTSGAVPWNKGKKMPEHTCQKMRDKAFGRVQTAETIARRVSKTTGKKRTEEQRAKLGGFKGRTHTEKSKKIMAEKRTGKKPSNYDYSIYEWINTDNGSMEKLTKSDFGKKYNIPSGNIAKLFNKERKTVKGWALN